MNGAQTETLVNFIAGALPTWRPTADTVSAWAVLLAGSDFEAVLRAAQRHLASSKWAPTPAELLEAVGEEADPIPSAEEVLAEVLAAVRRTPWGERPRGLSSVAQGVVDAMGWARITDSENPEALRAHLLRLAETYRKRACADRADGLVGLPAARRYVPTLPAPAPAAAARCSNG